MTDLPTIRKNVPLPKMQWVQIQEERVQFLKSMKIGDSFVVPTRNVSDTWQMLAKRYGVPVTTRKENGTGIGIWRVKEWSAKTKPKKKA